MVEQIVREVRGKNTVFGGLQVILCGDFFQLPPINKPTKRYGSFVTGSAAYQRGNFKSCFLEEDFRVNENDPLLGILNAIRMQQFQANHRELLGTRRNPQPPLEGESIPVLCDEIKVAKEINEQRLQQLTGPSGPRPYVWRAELGPAAQDEKKYLVDLIKQYKKIVPEKLYLKEGAVVMFTKNDMKMGVSNGTFGTVSGFNEQGWPNVRLNSGQILTGVTPTDFYQEDGEGGRLATITQVPLALAWAITIHKSQGMTLDKAYISLGNAFARGLGYVALSRVRRLKDLSLWNWDVQNAHRVSDEAWRIEQQLKDESNETLALIQ
jgi:hypothetical protein